MVDDQSLAEMRDHARTMRHRVIATFGGWVCSQCDERGTDAEARTEEPTP